MLAHGVAADAWGGPAWTFTADASVDFEGLDAERVTLSADGETANGIIQLLGFGTITGIVCQPLVEEAKYSVDTIDSVLQGKSYNGSAASWFLELEAPVAWTGGEGKYQIETYRPIVNAVKEYYSD